MPNYERNREIIKYNLIGIGLNLFLSVFKLIVGFFANAHAIILDGINSLSDMVSLVITILSAHISGKRRDSAHPLGYGRLEYLGSFVVTAIVIYIGISMIIDSVRNILLPHEAPNYDVFAVTIMLVSLAGKISYGLLMRKKGSRLHSVSMVIVGTDSLGDALISASILGAILIYRFTGVDIEHYLCIFISLLIIKTGVNMLWECMTKLIGTRVDPALRKKIIDMAAGMDEVLNVSNLILHNYGENYYVGSIDITVDAGLTAYEIGKLSHRIKKNASGLGVDITSVGVTGIDTGNPLSDEIQDRIISIATKYKSIKRLQSFLIDSEENYLSFYLVPNYSIKTRGDEIKRFIGEVKENYPEMYLDIRTAIDM